MTFAYVLSFTVASTGNAAVLSSPCRRIGGARDDGSTTIPRASARLPGWGLKPIVFLGAELRVVSTGTVVVASSPCRRIGGARDDGSTDMPSASAKLPGWGLKPIFCFEEALTFVSAGNVAVLSSPCRRIGGARDDGSTTIPRASAKLPGWGLKPVVVLELEMVVASTDDAAALSSPCCRIGGARDDGSTTIPKASAKLPG